MGTMPEVTQGGEVGFSKKIYVWLRDNIPWFRAYQFQISFLWIYPANEKNYDPENNCVQIYWEITRNVDIKYKLG